MYTQAEIDRMNKSSRSAGAVGTQAIVPRLVRDYLVADGKVRRVLDYGAGRDAIHAQWLRGFGADVGVTVDAWDMGNNRNWRHIDPETLHDNRGTYDIVYASNVLNVQPSLLHIEGLVRQLRDMVADGGRVVVNFPKEPRYSNADQRAVFHVLNKYFTYVRRERVNGAVWTCYYHAPTHCHECDNPHTYRRGLCMKHWLETHL